MPAAPRERPLTVLHAPAVVGGHPPMLAEAERRLGLDSRTVAVDPPPYGYAADEVLGDRGAVLRELRRWRTLVRALRDVDVVHFNFGSSLLPRSAPGHRHTPAAAAFELYARAVELRDVPLLRRAGKRIFVTYQGDDVRPSSAAHGLAPDAADDVRKARAAEVFARHADGIYALNPDLLDYLPARARFLPYASVDLDAWRPVAPPASSGRLVVVHAPTDTARKGTSELVAAVERLRSDGLDLELVLVTDVSREAARREFERADLGVDQLLSGWYGGVSVELMALGKPVVAHVDDEWLSRIPAGMRAQLPLIDATPSTIEEVLGQWLTRRRAELPQIGAQGRAFVEEWHDPARVAATVIADYERAVAGR